jgi:pilus assembly protein CpaB
VKWQPWPKDGLNSEYVVKGGKHSEKDFVGAVVRSAIVAGQPITDHRVVHPGDRGFLAAVLTPGLRAVSVPVNPTTGISGFVFPGDLVDVLLTVKFSSEDDKGKRHTRYLSETLLTGVRVLAIDQRTENADGEVKPVKTVTLEVSPKHAETIAIGLELGSLTLSLHSLAREAATADPKALKVKLAEMVPDGGKRGSSFTLDGQIFHMLAPGGHGGRDQVSVLRGGEASSSSAKGSRP